MTLFSRLIAVYLAIFAVTCASAETVRIGLLRGFKGTAEVTVSCTSDLSLSDTSGRTLSSVKCGEQVIFHRTPSGIEFTVGSNTSATASEVEIASSSTDALISLDTSKNRPAQYRGKIIVRAGESGLLLVNEVDIEDYLLGVLPSEMPAGFKTEAVKAQAVAARTYVWAHRGRHEKQGYDLCDGTDCQVYLGASGEKTPTSDAVKQTAGLVAICQGHLISALYSSDCGGTTQCGKEPYLTSIADHLEDGIDLCDHDGHSWAKEYPIAEFEKAVQKLFPEIKGITGVSITEIDASLRVKDVKIDTDGKSVTINAAKLRNLLGNTVIKSTIFTVKLVEGNVVFTGRGFGHGIGLCQFGANGLASMPHNYTFDQILKHYYSGIDIVPVSTLSSTARNVGSHRG